MKTNRLRSPLLFLVASASLVGLSAAGCGGSSGSGTGGTAGHSATGGHGGVTGGSAGGSSGSVGGAGGSVASGGGSSGLGGTAGQSAGTAGAGAGGAAGSGVATGGAGGSVVGSGGAAGGTATGGAGGTSTGGAGGTSTGGAGGAATGGAGGSGSGAPGKVGIVGLTETTMTYNIPGLGSQTIVGSGAVATYLLPGTAGNCPAPTTAGACQLFPTCTSPAIAGAKVDAGSVSITGLATSPVTLNHISASDNGYISTAYTSYLWSASVPTTVTVGGSASVPQYTMNIDTPNPITMTAPIPSGTAVTGAAYVFPKTSDLVVSWTGGVQGQVVIGLATMNVTPAATIACTVAASAGTVTIPASLMSGFGTMAGFTASVSTSATKNVNDWLMDFQATTGAAVGTVTFGN